MRTLMGLAGAVCVGSLLFATAGCAGEDEIGPPSSGKGARPGAQALAEVTSLKVCALVDLRPLMTAMKARMYVQQPTDVPRMRGIDPGGPQCAAQLKPAARPGDLIGSGRLNVAVVAYSDAAAKFAERVADAESRGQTARTPARSLTGPWTKGALVVKRGAADGLWYAVAYKDGYILKVELIAPSTTGPVKVPYTSTGLETAVTNLLESFAAAVSSQVG